MTTEHEHFERLLVQATDDCLSADETRELEAHLATCSVCAADLAAFTQVKAATDEVRQRIIEDVLHDPIRPSKTTRAINRVGFFALLFAAVIAVGFAALGIWRDDSVAIELRVGILVAMGIALLVFGNVLRLRLRSAPTDPYREIDQ